MAKLQLKKYEPEPWLLRDQLPEKPPTTPSEWWSKHFPAQAKRYGTPFLELVEQSDIGIETTTPLKPNIDFFAACVGGDTALGHRVIYIESECGWYFYDCAAKIYKQTSDEKLGNLIRALMIRCAEELANNIGKANLFLEFRSDKTIREIVHRAKSILAADSTFFGVDSENEREQGPELYERVAKVFVEQCLERQAGEILTVNETYERFLEYLKARKMEPVNRKVFRSLVPPAVKEEFDLGIRNDIHEEARGGWKRGWVGLHALELVEVGANN